MSDSIALRSGAPMDKMSSVAFVMDKEHEKGATNGVAHFSALYGLVGVTKCRMKDLASALELYCKRWPTTEKGVFSAIIRHLYPDADQERVEELWKRRGTAEREKLERGTADKLANNFEHVDGVLHAKDAEEINAVIVKARAALKEKLSDARASLAGVVTKSRGAEIDIDYARRFKPPTCSLDKETGLF